MRGAGVARRGRRWREGAVAGGWKGSRTGGSAGSGLGFRSARSDRPATERYSLAAADTGDFHAVSLDVIATYAPTVGEDEVVARRAVAVSSSTGGRDRRVHRAGVSVRNAVAPEPSRRTATAGTCHDGHAATWTPGASGCPRDRGSAGGWRRLRRCPSCRAKETHHEDRGMGRDRSAAVVAGRVYVPRGDRRAGEASWRRHDRRGAGSARSAELLVGAGPCLRWPRVRASLTFDAALRGISIVPLAATDVMWIFPEASFAQVPTTRTSLALKGRLAAGGTGSRTGGSRRLGWVRDRARQTDRTPARVSSTACSPGTFTPCRWT
jgi:hypothetical protein